MPAEVTFRTVSKESPTPEDLARGERFKQLRERAEFTQEDIDPARSTVINVEKGKNKLTGTTLLQRYCKAFGLSQEQMTDFRDGKMSVDLALELGATKRCIPKRQTKVREFPLGLASEAPGEQFVEVRHLRGWDAAVTAARAEMDGEEQDFVLAGLISLPRLPGTADKGLAMALVSFLRTYCRGSGMRQRAIKR